MFEPVVIDSTIWYVHLDDLSVRERTLSEIVTDYYIDDFLYVLTPRTFYKLNIEDLSIHDRIPLPQRFNYVTSSNTNVALIAPDEIILISKRNLGYVAGIGIEYGDTRPLRVPEHFTPASPDVLYLITDSGSKSTLRMLNVQTGEASRRLDLDKIVYYVCDCLTPTIQVLDAANRITILDPFLRQKKTFTPEADADWFTQSSNGYCLGNENGFFYTDAHGRVIDFLPVNIADIQSTDKLIALNKHGVLICDPLTLRAQQFIEFNTHLTHLVRERTDKTMHVILVDTFQTFYAVGLQTGTVDILRKEVTAPVAAARHGEHTETDSVWYFQTGAYATAENARANYTALRQRGIPVCIDTGALYRVKLGGFPNKADALSLVENAGLNGWFVLQQRINRSERVTFSINTITYVLQDGIIMRSTP